MMEYEKWLEAKGQSPDVVQAVLSSMIGGWSGHLPDKIEPGGDPTHRGPAHSHELEALLEIAVARQPDYATMDFSNLLFRIGMKGYLSHLSLDKRTPMGLHSVIGRLIGDLIE